MRDSASFDVLYIGSPFYHHNREVFSKKITRILSELAKHVHVFGANRPTDAENVSWTKSEITEETSGIQRYAAFVAAQFRVISFLRNHDSNFDVIIIRSASFFLPTAYARISRIPSATIVTQKTRLPLLNALTKLNFYISHRLIVESENVIREWHAEKFLPIVLEGAGYVDSDSYYQMTDLPDRANAFGYVGILDDRKGVDGLIESIVGALDQYDVAIKIGGSGPLRKEVERLTNSDERVEYLGFVPDEQMRAFYNSIKLLVLPTESEGVPNVVLEAMACGTPVLTTPVGGIPDIIDDGVNGFLMPDNSPETIATHVRRALESDDLADIGYRGKQLIEDRYRFESAVERYRKIIYEEM